MSTPSMSTPSMSTPSMSEVAPRATFDSTVVLELGGDIGALVLEAPECLAGAEIDLEPCHGVGGRTHSAVRARHMPGAVRHAAVFSPLRAGEYRLLDREDRPVAHITVLGGRVTEAAWPTSALPPMPNASPPAVGSLEAFQLVTTNQASPQAHDHTHPLAEEAT
jgi:hypothetical protein